MKRLIITSGPMAAAVAVSLAAPAASGITAVSNTSAAPAPLVGKWTRMITAADVKRVGATRPIYAGMICTLTVKKDGVLNASVICRGGQPGGFQGTIDGTASPSPR